MEKTRYREKPDLRHYLGSAIQIIALFIALVAFVWESQTVTPENTIIFYLLGLGVIFSVIGIFIYQHVKLRFDKIDWLESEVKKLNDQISFRKSLEKINYRLGKLNGNKKVK